MCATGDRAEGQRLLTNAIRKCAAEDIAVENALRRFGRSERQRYELRRWLLRRAGKSVQGLERFTRRRNLPFPVGADRQPRRRIRTNGVAKSVLQEGDRFRLGEVYGGPSASTEGSSPFIPAPVCSTKSTKSIQPNEVAALTRASWTPRGKFGNRCHEDRKSVVRRRFLVRRKLRPRC